MKRALLALLLLVATSVAALSQESARYIALRLKPGQDLKGEIQALVEREKLPSGAIVTAVGSLRRLRLRLADQHQASEFEGPFEIVSLVGTLSPQGLHLHLSASDAQGRTLGGHLVDGNPVYTTVELVIVVPPLRFLRKLDPASGYPELEVESPSSGAKASSSPKSR